MSTRRKVGDWVWLRSYAGFLKSGAPMHAQIQNDGGDYFCYKNCGDKQCFEWATLHTDDAEMLCHVLECDMFDSKEEAETSEAAL